MINKQYSEQRPTTMEVMHNTFHGLKIIMNFEYINIDNIGNECRGKKTILVQSHFIDYLEYCKAYKKCKRN
jgi:hypothetical protein